MQGKPRESRRNRIHRHAAGNGFLPIFIKIMIDRNRLGIESIRILHNDTRQQPTPRTTAALRAELLHFIHARETALHRFLCCYLAASNDDTGAPFQKDGYSIDDVATRSLLSALAECSRFMRANAADLTGISDFNNGQCFWRTRTHQTSEFDDEKVFSDEPLTAMQQLTAASHAFGAVDLTIGDDEKLHFSNEHSITTEFNE
jgi:hypothetical protein